LYPQQDLKRLLDKICPGRVKQGERLGPYTTIQIGGRADWFIQPKTISEMKKLLDVVKVQNIPWFVLGQGSNLLVSDRGVRGIVIQCSSPRMPKPIKRFKDGQILMEVEAAFPLSRLVGFGIKNQLRGLEFLAGIPGSIGGAWAMNAGSYGKEMKDITVYLKTVTSEGRLIRKGKKQLGFGYRTLKLEPGEVIMAGGIKLSSGDAESIQKETRRLWTQRRAAQPLNRPSCGSVFKNPPEDFAGRLIEKAGLKGVQKGGAQVSNRHANFIVNQGEARARDVLFLMNLIRTRVRKQFGILLEPEVRLWGCSLKDA
jgi:UDP-N-acetylmuramate dehydrogenase